MTNTANTIYDPITPEAPAPLPIKYLIAYRDAGDNFEYFGPFSSEHDALEFANKCGDFHGWWISIEELSDPKEHLVGKGLSP